MSSYQEEYRKGYEDGMDAARAVANQMYRDGLNSFKELDTKDETVKYHMNKVFDYLKVTDERIIKRYIGYVLSEGELVNEQAGISRSS